MVMSERTFFGLRYALPGYTFILVSVLVAYPGVRDLFIQNQNIELIGVFLAFFTLLGGGAIGFLISQFWYIIHNNFLKKFFLQEARKFLKDKYKLAKDVHHQMVFLDHVHHLSDETMRAYTRRRFDLMHTLASTLSAILIGVSFGILVRIGFFRTDITYEKALQSLSNVSVNLDVRGFAMCWLGLALYDLAVIIILALLSSLLLVGFLFIRKEHSMMVQISVQKMWSSKKIPYSKARMYFTKDYFANNKKGKET